MQYKICTNVSTNPIAPLTNYCKLAFNSWIYGAFIELC